MRRTHVRKTEYVGLFVEPDLRATIEGEARRHHPKINCSARHAEAANYAGMDA